MAEISTLGVVGLDGVSPVYNPEGKWQLWSIDDIWMGTGPGKHRFVPKVKDYVIDPETSSTYIVDFIDPVTLIPTLRDKRLVSTSYTLSETDLLFGVGPGNQLNTYIVYLDTSVTPHVLAVDARIKIPGVESSYAKIFKGPVLGTEGRVLSKMYDNSGNFVSENVPLEICAIDSHINYSIKVPKVCYCTEPLLDGDIVTLVAYSSQGHVTYKRQLRIENTAFIRDVNASTRYVSHISLRSPFLSTAETNTLNFPLNVPANAFNLKGVVNYSDGSELELPVDGTKFSMLGLNQFLSSIPGQKVKLVLSYKLGNNEVAYGAIAPGSKMVVEPYDLVTTNQNNSYSVKLYGYPEWVNATVGYRMRWFLFNLDRNISFDVTDKVQIAGSDPFDSFADNYTQRRTVYVNLRDVSAIFKPFVHSQVVSVVLRKAPQLEPTPWTMLQEDSVGHEPYGIATSAKKVPGRPTDIKIKCGCTTLEEWKQKVYLKTYPLLDRTVESSPLEPTHFEIMYGTYKAEYPITDWDQTFTMNKNIPVGSTVYIKFIRRTTMTDLELSIAGMMVQN